jgi:hypothetical protein
MGLPAAVVVKLGSSKPIWEEVATGAHLPVRKTVNREEMMAQLKGQTRSREWV